MDTKIMNHQSGLKPKQIEPQPHRKLLHLPGKDSSKDSNKDRGKDCRKDSSSLVSRCAGKKKANISRPTGSQNKSDTHPKSSTTSCNAHSTIDPDMNSYTTAAPLSTCLIQSSLQPSLQSSLPSSLHSTLGPGSSKPDTMVSDSSKKPDRMISTNGRTANHTTNSTDWTFNPMKNQSDHHRAAVGQSYPCQLCGFQFDDIKRLNFHLVKIHNVDKRITLIQCYAGGCEEKFRRRMELVDHLNGVHQLDVRVLQRTVASLEDFQRWKDDLERESGCTWKQNNKFFLNNRLRVTYICDKPATNGSKLYSLHGPSTINNQSTFCLSSIKMIEGEDGNFLIEFIETHNHDE